MYDRGVRWRKAQECLECLWHLDAEKSILNRESRITNLEGLVITNSLATNGKAGKAVEEGNQIVNN